MGLHIVAAAIGVAEIEHVDDKRRQHAIHNDVTEYQSVDDGVLAAPAAGLDTQTTVRMVHQALGHGDVLDAAAHLAADDKTAVAAAQAAVADDNVLTGNMQLHA